MKYIIVCIINLAFTVSLFAQSDFRANVSKRGTTAASFLEIGAGARALAMGTAYTAVADDPSAIYWNAASIARMSSNSILINHSEWIADIQYDYVASIFSLGDLGTVGLSVTALSTDRMEITTVDEPEGTGETFKVGDYAISVAYAISLTDKFAIGFNPKIIHQYIWEMSATGIAIDVGVHYITPFDNLELGFSMTNFGSKMHMTGDNARIIYDYDPESTGHNERTTAILETSNWVLPINFRIGLMYKALDTERHRILLAVDAQHPNNDYESINAGMEYVYNQTLALRSGYRSLFLADTQESFTIGAGINYKMLNGLVLHFDFAYADFGILENVQKYSLTIDF